MSGLMLHQEAHHKIPKILVNVRLEVDDPKRCSFARIRECRTIVPLSKMPIPRAPASSQPLPWLSSQAVEPNAESRSSEPAVSQIQVEDLFCSSNRS